MADNTLLTSALIFADEYSPRIISTANNVAKTARMISVIQGSGKNCAWALKGDSDDAEYFSEGADLANFDSPDETPATLQWALVRKGFHVSDLARSVADSSVFPQHNGLWNEELLFACEKQSSKLNKELFTGDGYGGLLRRMAGLDYVIGETTNTFAGVDRSLSQNANLRPYVIDPGSSTSPTLVQIRADLTAIEKQCGERPDYMIASLEVYDRLVALYDTNRRYVENGFTLNSGKLVISSHTDTLYVEGVPVYGDKDATANRIYYMNSRYVELRPIMDPANVAMAAIAQVRLQDGVSVLPFGANFKLLASAGSSEKGMVYSQIQLVVKKPLAFGVRKNVSTT